jgi:hypothetical protein
MAQDRPDDDVTSVFKPGASGSENNGPVSFEKPSSTPEAGGYDPTLGWSQPNSQPNSQPTPQPGAQQNPYGQSWDPNAAAQQANPYAQNPYAQNPYGQQQGYDPANPYAAQQQGGAGSWDPNQYPQYGQSAGNPWEPNNPYGQQPNAYGQYPAPQQPYGGGYQPGYTPPTNGMAIAALILAFVFPPLGIVFGIMGRNQIKQSGESGDGMALAGIIIGGVFTALFVLFFVFFIIVGIAASSAVGSGLNGY